MFKVIAQPTVEWPVKVDYGGADEPRLSEPFTATFRILPVSEAVRLFQEGDAAALLRRALIGWRDIAMGEEPLAFSDEALERLLDRPRERNALFKAYQAASRGEREGN